MKWLEANLLPLVVVSSLAACGLSYYAGFRNGKAIVQQAWDKERTQVIEAGLQRIKKQVQYNFSLGKKHLEGIQEREERTTTIIKEIPVYLKDNPHCKRLPNGFSLLHNKAARGAD